MFKNAFSATLKCGQSFHNSSQGISPFKDLNNRSFEKAGPENAKVVPEASFLLLSGPRFLILVRGVSKRLPQAFYFHKAIRIRKTLKLKLGTIGPKDSTDRSLLFWMQNCLSYTCFR